MTEDPKNDSEAAGTPRWVKIFGLIALAVVVLAVVILVVGGGHGPSRHTSDAEGSHRGPPAGVAHPQP
jgi:ABC-type transporter Mla subunit MlaD